MTYSQIVKAIATSNLSTEQLENINTLVVDTINSNRVTSDNITKASLKIGMTVQVADRSCLNTDFKIIKINKTKVVVSDSRNRSLNVPISLLVF